MTILTCLGDSITDCEHCFSRDFLGNGYVKMLSDCLKRDGSDYQVRNYGTDGFTINRLLQRIQGDSDFTSDIITILIGINDIGLIMNTDRTPFQQRNMLFLLQMLCRSYNNISKIKFTHYFNGAISFPGLPVIEPGFLFARKISQMIHQLSEQFQIPYLTLHEELNEKGASLWIFRNYYRWDSPY